MYGGNYSAVIGWKEPIAWNLIPGTYQKTRFSTMHSAVIGYRITMAWKLIFGTYQKTHFSTNHSAIFSPVHQTTTMWATVVDPSHPYLIIRRGLKTTSHTNASIRIEIRTAPPSSSIRIWAAPTSAIRIRTAASSPAVRATAAGNPKP